MRGIDLGHATVGKLLLCLLYIKMISPGKLNLFQFHLKIKAFRTIKLICVEEPEEFKGKYKKSPVIPGIFSLNLRITRSL